MDLSGHSVGYTPSSEGMDYMAMMREYRIVKEVWDAVCLSDPRATQALIDSDKATGIGLGTVNSPLGTSIKADEKGNVKITLDNSLMDADPQFTESRLGGEVLVAKDLVSGPDSFSQLFIIVGSVTLPIFQVVIGTVAMAGGIVMAVGGIVTLDPAIAYVGLIVAGNGYNLYMGAINQVTGWNIWTIPYVPRY